MKDEEDRNIEKEIRRFKFLGEQCRETFNRLEHRDTALKGRSFSLIGLVIATVSIVITIIGYIMTQGYSFHYGVITISGASYLFLIGLTLYLNYKVIKPGKYKGLGIFKKGRLEELMNDEKIEEIEVYQDYLYHIRKAFKMNKEKYQKKINLFHYSLISFGTSLIPLMVIFLYVIII